MSRDLDFTNARIVLADRVLDGSLSVRDGVVAAIDAGANSAGVDLEGDYLIPGLVELHTDHLENHYRPRPGVFWDPMAALQAHDGQIAASGITTVFDAVRIGSDLDMPEMGQHVGHLVNAIRTGREQDRLRADHFIHLRCELPSHDLLDHFEAYADHPLTRLASVMDHTPGQRQFQSLDDYKRFYKEKMGRSAKDTEKYLADRQAEHDRYSAVHRTTITRRAAELGLALASHDDATVAHVDEAVRDGVRIAEFPTSLAAAKAAHEAGLAILMGGPNVVRGKSHSGNVSATELAREGVLDILSSDYVPFALLQAAFLLPERVETIDLPAALRTVTLNPARAAQLEDRGEIAVGKRADLVHVEVIAGMPVVRGVWRQGKRVG